MRRRCLDSRRGMRLLWILTRPPFHIPLLPQIVIQCYICIMLFCLFPLFHSIPIVHFPPSFFYFQFQLLALVLPAASFYTYAPCVFLI